MNPNSDIDNKVQALTKRQNLENLRSLSISAFLLFTVLILVGDSYSYFSGIWKNDGIQYYLFLARLSCIPMIGILVYTLSSKLSGKRWTKNLSEDFFVIINIGLHAPIILIHYYLELSSYNSSGVIIIYSFSIAMLLKLRLRARALLILFLVLMYYIPCIYLEKSIHTSHSVYINGVSTFFICAYMARFYYKTNYERVKNKILAHDRMKVIDDQLEEINTINQELSEKNVQLRSELKKKLTGRSSEVMWNEEIVNFINNDLDAPVEQKQAMLEVFDRKNKDDNYEEIDSLFNSRHQEFFQKLREEYPNLTAKNLKLCAYVRMNLELKEISNLEKITVQSVRVYKGRLKKKLGLTGDDSLETFLANF